MTAVQKKRLTAALCAMMFAGACCNMTQGALLTDFIGHYVLVSARQGAVSSFQTAGNIASLLLVGFLLGRLRKYCLLAVSAVVIPSVFFLMGIKPAFAALLLLYFFYGAAFGFVDTLASSVMVDLHPDGSGRFLNLIHGVYGVGALCAPAVLQLLSEAGVEWNILLVCCGALALASGFLYLSSAVPVLRIKRNAPENAGKLRLGDIKKYLSSPPRRILLFCAVLYGAHQIGVTVWVNRYISEYLGSPRWGAAALSFFWLGIASSRLAVMKLRFEPRKILRYGYLFSGLFLLAGVVAARGPLMAVCTLLAGAAEGPTLPIALDLACRREPQNTSFGSTMLLLGHNLGLVAAPPAMAFLISNVSPACGMLLPVITALLASVFACRLPVSAEDKT